MVQAVASDRKAQECHIGLSHSRPSTAEKPKDFRDEGLPTENSDSCKLFEKVWASCTEDNNLALYGFRRFKTTHLLNLRLLEEEIDRIDHQIYQAGLKLGMDPTPADRLGLKHCKKDEHALRPEDVMDEQLILKLRHLLKQYGKSIYMEKRSWTDFQLCCKDDGLAVFNQIMAMETFSMLDDQRQSALRTDLSLYETYKTRLVRVDLGLRTLQDPFNRGLHKYLRWFRYWKLSGKSPKDHESGPPLSYCDRSTQKWSYQNTVVLADTIWRVLVAVVANVFIVVPLAILSFQSSKGTQLITIAVWIVAFSFLVSIFFKASNQATVAVIAAYAAVLSVFISNGSACA